MSLFHVLPGYKRPGVSPELTVFTTRWGEQQAHLGYLRQHKDYSLDSAFCCLTLIFTDDPPFPPSTHVIRPRGCNSRYFLQYSQYNTGTKFLVFERQ